MREYSKEEIGRLIETPKIIIEAPRKKLRLEKGCKRNDMRLKSTEGELGFTVFMRILEKFPENFSIGLEYWPKDEPGHFCLLRCNGPHGMFKGGPEISAHFKYHIHRAKPENMRDGLRPEMGGEPVKDYASYEEALAYFLRVINAVNASEYFSNPAQLRLALQGEEKDL